MCNCGCNTCETKGPLLTEGKVKSLLSEGLQYHIDKKIPLFETVYRIGSKKHLSLIKEARKMYSRNIIDLCEEDEALIKTHLGEFALYEGVSIPLDLPMLEAEIDYEKEKTWKIQDKFPIEVTARKGWSGNYYTIEPKPMDISYDAFIDLGSGENVGYSSYDYTTGEAQWTSDSLEQIKQWEEDNQDKIKVIYPKSLNESKIPTQDQVDKFFALTQNETHYLNSKPVAGQEGTFNLMKVEPWDGYDLSNWNSLVRKAKSKGQVNESKYEKEETIQQTIDRLKARLDDPNDGMNVSFIVQKIKNLEKSLNESYDYDEVAQSEFGMDYDQLGSGEKEWVRDEIDNMSINETNKISDDKLMRLIPKMPKGYGGKNAGIGKYIISTPDGEDIVLTQSKDKKNWFYEPSNVALKILNEEQKSKDLKYKIKVGVKEALQEAKKEIDEAEFKGKEVALNKPKRGGPKAYYVYVKDGDKVKKVTFGSGGLRAKIKNKEARNAFAARHNCKDKKDRTKAGYWSCNLPRYAPALGLGAKMNTFW